MASVTSSIDKPITIDSERIRELYGIDLYQLVRDIQPHFAPRITGMLLDLSEEDVVGFIESEDKRKEIVDEAQEVLAAHFGVISDLLTEVFEGKSGDQLSEAVRGMACVAPAAPPSAGNAVVAGALWAGRSLLSKHGDGGGCGCRNAA